MRLLLRAMGAVATAWVVVGLCWSNQSAGQETGTATFGTSVVLPSGLRGLVYYLRPGESWLPNFSRLKPVGAIYTASLNVQPQDWSYGFPGISKRFEWFAIDYTGKFWIDTPADYQFSLTSDDGSKLYIDEKMLINNDGMHEPQTAFGRIRLDCGIHHIRVQYFQGPRYQVALVLSVAPAKKKWRVFSTEEFKPPSNPEDWVCGGVPVPVDPLRTLLPDVGTQRAVTAFEEEAMRMLDANPRPQDVAVRLGAFHFWRGAGGVQSSIVAAVPGTSLTATRTAGPAPVNKVHVDLFALIKGENGRVVERFAWDGPYAIPDQQYAAVREHDLIFSHPVHLPDGRYFVETAAMDREGHRGGTMEIVVDTPRQRSGIGLSSLVLVDRVEPVNGTIDAADPLIFERKRVMPRLAALLNTNEKTLVYFVVYPDPSNSVKPTLQVRYLDGDRPIAEQTAELPAPDASGAIPMFVTMVPRPGGGRLKITVLQGNDSASDTLDYRVSAK